MAKYKITLLLDGAEMEYIKEGIEEELNAIVDKNKTMAETGHYRKAVKAFEQAKGYPFDISFAWEWKSNILIFYVLCTMEAQKEKVDETNKHILRRGLRWVAKQINTKLMALTAEEIDPFAKSIFKKWKHVIVERVNEEGETEKELFRGEDLRQTA